MEESIYKYFSWRNYLSRCFGKDFDDTLLSKTPHIKILNLCGESYSAANDFTLESLKYLRDSDLTVLPTIVNLVKERDRCLGWIRKWSNLSDTADNFVKGLPGITDSCEFEGTLKDIYSRLRSEPEYEILLTRYLTYRLLEN